MLEEIAIASASSGLCIEEWFRRLLTMSNDYDHITLDIVCQNIFSKVIYFIRETHVASDRSRFSNFRYQVCNCID